MTLASGSRPNLSAVDWAYIRGVDEKDAEDRVSQKRREAKRKEERRKRVDEKVESMQPFIVTTESSVIPHGVFVQKIHAVHANNDITDLYTQE